MSMYGNDYRYADSRLAGSMVRNLEGLPVYVDCVQEDGDVVAIVYENNVPNEKILSLDDLDLTPVELGYVNTEEFGAVYACRRPMRRDWRQGLRHNNIVVLGRNINPASLSWLEYCKTILGDFPKFDSIVDKLRERKLDTPAAWCRQFSLHPDSTVYYCGERVGEYSLKHGKIMLNKEHVYLQEALEEVL